VTTASIREIGEPRLELLYEAHIDLDLPQVIGPTPQGMRQIFCVTGGFFEGPRMKGEVLPGGGDWLLVRPDGVFQLDIRATVRTDDGALIYLSYYGLIDATPGVLARIQQGQDVPVSDYYFYVAPMFQTAAPKYEWLNRRLAIGKGKIVPRGVEYRVFALA
jgi:hypothetical protein